MDESLRQMYLVLAWRVDDVEAGERAVLREKIEAHVRDEMVPPLTPREMNEILYAAKAKFAQIARRRKKLYRAEKGPKNE